MHRLASIGQMSFQQMLLEKMSFDSYTNIKTTSVNVKKSFEEMSFKQLLLKLLYQFAEQSAH